MKQNRIDESNILATTAIVLIILFTGVRSEDAKNLEEIDAILSRNHRLQESLISIINEIQQNVNSIKDEILQKMHAISNETQQNLLAISDEMRQNMNSIRSEIQQHVAAIGNETQRDQKQENSQLPTTCAEALLSGNGRSGIYHLYLHDYNLRPFEVQCLSDPDNGPAWTIIQRRQDYTTGFYRGWKEYQRGFGDLNTNYFIGLNKIHLMTHAQPHELWIELKDFEGETRYAKYNAFGIGDEYDSYNLHTLGKFIGNAGDSLTSSKGYKFATKDTENNASGARCAEDRKGAWWYRDCTNSNLNGIYQNKISVFSDGIFWHHWRGQQYSLKYVHMAIRPKKIRTTDNSTPI